MEIGTRNGMVRIFFGFLACILMGSCNVPVQVRGVTLVPPPTNIPETQIPSATAIPSPSPAPAVTQTTMPTETPLRSQTPAILRMLDIHIGWMVTVDGVVMRTETGTDGWKNVTPLKAPLPQGEAVAQLPAVYFLSGTHAWLAYSSPDAAGLYILRTSDGGQTWLEDSNLPQVDYGGSITPVSMQFLNTQNGWLWAQIYPGMNHVYPVLFHTTDNGQNWQIVYDPRPSADEPNESLKGAYSLSFGTQLFTFLDAMDGFAGTGFLQATHDGGKTWTTISLQKPEGLPQIVQPYVYVAPPVFCGSKDGVAPVFVYDFESVYSPPGDMFNGYPKAFYLAWTHNGGKSWNPKTMPAPMGTFSLINGNTAWFLGKNDPDPNVPARLFITLDGGDTWDPWGESSPLPLGSQLQFINRFTGYAIAPEYGGKRLFKPFDSRLGDGGYLYQVGDWSRVN